LNPTNPITFSLAGKSAIVTGGCSGIGLAIARRFREHGGRVLIADRHLSAGGLTDGGTEYDLVPPANIQNGRGVDDV